jgi:hypothetical protein
MSGAAVCPDCGREVNVLGRELTFGLPDEIFALSDKEQEQRVLRFGKTFVTLDADRFFLRVLLPVQLDVGHEFRFGVWIEVPRNDYKRVWDLWDETGYATVSVKGVLANAVPPWSDAISDAPCTAAARNATDALYIESSTHLALASVLTTPWAVHECEELIGAVWGDSLADG